MQTKILHFLKKATNYISGEEISDNLKISRQGLWKHIETLRESGYDILAVPHLGYKLVSSPDRLFPSEIKPNLKTKYIGKKIYYFESLPSTMDTAMQLGLKGAEEGTLVLAETQSHGRGRMGRPWVSPKYKGIYLSLILRPQIPPQQLSILTLLAAVSAVETVNEVFGQEAKIKWPNDILLNGKKLGGILTEINAEVDQMRFVVIGIGININNDKKSLLPQATSLKEERGESFNRISLLQKILKSIEDNYESFKTKGNDFIIDKWRASNVTLGKRVKVNLHHVLLEGQAVGIDSDGALLLRKDSGITQRVTSGDITLSR